MSIEAILSRVNKVRKSSSNSWMACCPAHDDKNPSLSIRDLGDGRILLNCLAGCETLDVLGAVGMEWSDVMPEKVAHHAAPVKQRIYATDALRVIQYEARIVMMAAYTMRRGERLADDDLARLELAMERINVASEASNVSA
jgi:hypothetical protein